MSNQAVLHTRIIRYFKLRPAFKWSILSFIILIVSLFIIRWNTSTIIEDLKTFDEFEMVELRLPKAITQPDIDVSDEISEETVEEIKEEDKPLRFGDESGEFSDIFNTSFPPRPIYDFLPAYPQSMRKAGIEGVVVIELGIDENGNLLYGRIIRSLGKEFDVAVIKWAQQLKFHPALDRDKKPIRCRIRLPIRFKLID